MERNDYLNVGIIIKTRGLKGTFKIKSTSYFAKERYKKNSEIYLVNEKEEIEKKLTVKSYSNEGEFDFVTFNEISSIEEAEKYIGWYLQIKKDELPPLPKNTYYFNDLLNLSCVDEEGNIFGTVKKVEDFTSQISLRIELKNKKTILIPFVDFYIKKVDLENKIITIHLIPGIIE